MALLAGGLGALGVLVPFAWPLTPSDIPPAVGVAAISGLLIFIAVRQLEPEPMSGWTLGRSQLVAGLPALAAALAADAVTRKGGFAGEWLAAIAVGVLGAAALRTPNPALRQLLAWLPALVALAVATAVSVSSARYGDTPGLPLTVRGEPPPTIVLIVLDTVRADHLAMYGYPRNTMPALEKWAQDAIIVKRAVSAGGWTAPAHASMFSGRSVSSHGIHYSSDPDPDPETGSGKGVLRTKAREGIEWLPERLRQYGYRTLAVTANPLAVPEEVSGFDVVLAPRRELFNGATIGGLADRLSPPTNRVSERLGWRIAYVDAEGIVDITMRSADAAGPLFLFVNMVDAHSPYNPPQQALDLLGLAPAHLFDRYQSHHMLTRMWPGLGAGAQQVLYDLYDGELRFIDLQLARLLSWIELEFAGKAMVIVTADHGEELGERGRIGHEYGLAQSLIHVPLVIRAPGSTPGEIEASVSLRDLYNLILATASGRPPAVRDLMGGEALVMSERYPSSHNAGVLGPEYLRPWVAVIEGDVKVTGPSANGVEANVLMAPGFNEGEASVSTEVVQSMTGRIDDHWRRSRDDRGEAAFQQLNESEIEQLRGLGYLE